MELKMYGLVHFLYLGITIGLTIAGLWCAKKFAKTEKSQNIVLKSIAGLLLISILVNRFAQVFRDGQARWEMFIPDQYCAMSSFVLSFAVLFGKRDNNVLHFVWSLSLAGGIATILYPSYIGQGSSIFYLPTISGLLHHSISIAMVVALLLFKQINITYKKWYCVFFGFTTYLTLGAFQMSVLGLKDSFHIVEPLIYGTSLTAWVLAPFYFIGYAIIVFTIELVRRKKQKTISKG